MTNTREIRYYVGDESDLDCMDYFEVEASTYTFEGEAEEAVAESLDDIYGTVTIAGMEYTTSEALKSVDPIAWRCLLADMISEIDMSDYDDTGSED